MRISKWTNESILLCLSLALAARMVGNKALITVHSKFLVIIKISLWGGVADVNYFSIKEVLYIKYPHKENEQNLCINNCFKVTTPFSDVWTLYDKLKVSKCKSIELAYCVNTIDALYVSQ